MYCVSQISTFRVTLHCHLYQYSLWNAVSCVSAIWLCVPWLGTPLWWQCPLTPVQPVHTHLYCCLPFSCVSFASHHFHITNGSGIVWLNSLLNYNIIILLPRIKTFNGGTPLCVTCNIGPCVCLLPGSIVQAWSSLQTAGWPLALG
jgi:hypothetical protein